MLKEIKMKRIINQIFLSLLLVAAISSCKKDEHKDYFLGGTAPALTSSASGPFVLDITHKNDPLTKFSWTNPNYQFTTGLSSQDVVYTIQIDSSGKNFSSAALGEIVVPKELSKTISIGEFNSKVLPIIPENTTGEIEVRVKATLSTGAGAIYSNVVKYTVTPYLDVLFPVPANLYITGSATPASWQCGCGEPELLSQKFTKVSSSKFEITIALSANNSYLFIPVYGSWAHKYAFTGAGNANNVFGDNFQPDSGGDFKAPPTSGTYKISVDFKTGKFTVTQ